MKTVQFYLTPAAGKRLIAKGIAQLPQVREALKNGTILIIGGTTNGVLAEELLTMIGQAEGFDRKGFFRGITVPKGAKVSPHEFIGDVVIEKGVWKKGLTVFDVCDSLGKGDIIFKGANAFNIKDAEAGLLLGGNGLGTAGPAITAHYGRRVELIIPVGVEKRVELPIAKLAAICDAKNASGLKFLTMPGETYCELDAMLDLTGVYANILASGGICGAEGGCYFAAEGEDDEIEDLMEIIREIEKEPAFTL
ncbi:MAG: hypothetical protein J6D00_03370 [Christensenellaceae bacterium]|nr:hypothetical protein [Christensenellaceae bacterium]